MLSEIDRAGFQPMRRRLPATAITYARLRTGIETFLATTMATIGISLLAPTEWRAVSYGILAALAVVVVVFETLVIDGIRIRSVSYDLDSEFMRIRRGVLFLQDIIIPIDRILNVAIVQGPVLRAFGLAKVRFVAISHFDGLGPLRFQDAIRLRAEVQCHQDAMASVAEGES